MDIENMTREQIEAEIEHLENHNFILEMGSCSDKQYTIISRNNSNIRKLKEALKKFEN